MEKYKNSFVFLPMKSEHIKSAAMLRGTFSEFGYMSKMEAGFWEFFFSRIIEIPEVIAHVAIDKNSHQVVGYVIGATDDTVIRKSLTNWSTLPRTVWYVVRMLVIYPEQIGVFAKGLFMRNKKPLAVPPQRWVTWIVDINYRKSGIGLALYKHLCIRMHKAGVSKFYGSVDCFNDLCNKAHVKFGARNIGTLLVDGRWHYLWEHDLSKCFLNDE